MTKTTSGPYQRRGTFTCVGWQLTLCDPVWQVTSHSCEMGFPFTALCSFTFLSFLLLVRYVPNVAKRSIWDQCKKKYILRTDRWPTTNDQRPHIWPILGKFQMAISPRGVVRSTSCLVLHWGFRGRRIEWRYFRFRQIQDEPPSSKIQMAISPRRIVRFTPCLVLGWGFSGSADRMARFPVWTNAIRMWEKTMREE